MGKIERDSSVTGALSLTNSATTTARIPFGSGSGGVIIVDAVTGSANKITWNVAFGDSDTPKPLYNDGAVVETSIAVDRAYPIPDACFAATRVVPVLNADTATIRVSLKG